MSQLIGDRYSPQFELPQIDLCDAWAAQDQRSQSGDLVRLYLIPTSRAIPVIHNLLQKRAAELSRFSHPANLPLLDFGYDGANNCYFFVQAFAGAPERKAQLRLNQYLSNATLPWSLNLLQSLAAFMNDLHARGIAHGHLRSSGVRVNADTCEIEVAHTGLAGFVELLDLDGYQAQTFEEMAADDLDGFGGIVVELVCGQVDSEVEAVNEAIKNVPLPLRKDMVLLTGQWDGGRLSDFAAVSRTLQRMRRTLAAEDVYYLDVTNSAAERLHELGFIQEPEYYTARNWVNKEFARDVFGWSEPSRDGEGTVYRLTTSQMRLFCRPDRNSTPPSLLRIVAAHLVDPSTLTVDRERGLPIKAKLEAIHYEQVPETADITPLLQEIDAHVERAAQVRQSELQDKNRFQQWETLLAKQKHLLRAVRLPYIGWDETEGGTTLTVTLSISPDENKQDFSEDDVLCLTGKDDRQRPAGYLEDLTGNILKIGLTRNVFTDDFKGRGAVTIDNRQVEAVLCRQMTAMKKLRFRETVNPNLLDLLSDYGGLRIDNPSAVDFWFQSELDRSQKRAVQRALATRDLFLIQGPPGTGKTSVIAEMVLQIIEEESQARILISSQSNVAVNHALSKILEVRPGLSDVVVRVGREEKAGSAEDLLLDRQLQAWGDRVVERSHVHLAKLEREAAGPEGLTDVLGLLAETEQAFEQRRLRSEALTEARKELSELDAAYADLERALARTDELRQQAEGILAAAAPEDQRLRETIRSFQQEYLDWASAFLRQANEVSSLSFQRSESAAAVEAIENEIASLDSKIEEGVGGVNRFLETEFVTFKSTPDEQRKFLEEQYSGQQEEMARLGRIKRLVADWTQRVGRNRRDFETAYLGRCKVVGATCIGVAARGAISDLEFDWVIVDEAGRATHPELLVPMVRGRKIVLVGDHRQLPPIIGRDLDEALQQTDGIRRQTLETSLFQEIIEGVEERQNVRLPLTVQYRMHPGIGSLIGDCFYRDVDLENGTVAEERDHGLDWCSWPVVWYSTEKLPHHQEVKADYSRQNQAEIEVILKLLEQMNKTYTQNGMTGKTVGVITGYLAQKAAVRQQVLARQDRWSHLRQVEVNTVDAYQGRERDIIIYSVVRSNPKGLIGFLADFRRLNVALSRARELLIIVGDTGVEYAKVPGGRDNPFYNIMTLLKKL